MNIAFHTNQLSLRGTEVAMYDYAKYNEELLENTSIIISGHYDLNKCSHPLSIEKFKKRFPVYLYNNFNEVEKILDDNKIDVFYAQKAGFIDGVISKNRKTVIHTVFQYHQPHGNIYAYISKWLGEKYNMPFVPYMVTLPDINNNLRKELNIPEDAIVFGRYGGIETFDILFARDVVKESLDSRKDVYFLFMYTDKFIDHPRVIFLKGNQDLEYKVKFINSCDAMLHARTVGETFGLAVAEFSVRNKPVITFGGSQRESAHLQMLGEKALKYYNKQDLFNIINYFKPEPDKDWNAYRDYSPEKIMKIFKNVFLT